MNDLVTSYWLNNKFLSPSSKDVKALSDEFPELFGELGAIFPNLFLYNIENIDILSQNNEWIVRDGYLLLRYFFSRYAAPPASFKAKLYIQENTISAVPKVWEKHFYSFALMSKDNKRKESLKIIFNPNIPSIHSRLAPRILNRFKSIDVILSNKSLGLNFAISEKSIFSFIQELSSSHAKINRFELDHYASTSSDKGSSFISYQDEFLVGLSKTSFDLLSLNHTLLGQEIDTSKHFVRPINQMNSLCLSKRSITGIYQQSMALEQFINAYYEEENCPNFPFKMNFARCAFENWKQIHAKS